MIRGTDYPTRDGTCIRDYVHVADLAQAHELALHAVLQGRHAIYNLGSGTGYSNGEVIDAVRAITGREVPTIGGPRRAGDAIATVVSSDRAKRELGWVPRRAGLGDIVADAWRFYTSSTSDIAS